MSLSPQEKLEALKRIGKMPLDKYEIPDWTKDTLLSEWYPIR